MDEKFKYIIEHCDETTLYFFIMGMGQQRFYLNHDLADGRIESSIELIEDLALLDDKLKFAVEQMNRFGIITRNSDLTITQEYWDWYNALDKWRIGISDAEYQEAEKEFTNKVEKLVKEFETTNSENERDIESIINRSVKK